MDILNFISWIKSGRVVNTVDPEKTLLPVGLKDNRRDDAYLAGAISVTDLLELVPPLFGPNYILIEGKGTPVENGQELYDTYLAAITKTPNGLPLSDDNRYTILLAPGVYQLPSFIFWNTDFIDLACIDGVATLTRPTFQVPIIIGANDTQFSNIKLAFLFLENQSFIGWPISPNKSKVLLNNCSGYFENPSYSEEYTIDRDYLNTTVSRRISQDCLTSVSFFLGFNHVNLDPNAGSSKTQFFWSETNNLFAQSRFDLGAVGDSVWFSQGTAFTYAYIETQSLPLSDKYISMQISNLVGTFSVNDVVTQGGTTGIITETDGTSFFYAYVATGVFPNGTGTITNTTSGGTADNNGWSQQGNSTVTNGTLASGGTGNSNFMNISAVSNTTTSTYNATVQYYLQFDSQMYILYEGPNTSFDSGTGVSVIYNNLGGTAQPVWSTNAGELVIQNLSGTWDGATQIWSDINPTPVTITNRSQNIIHTLNKTVTNR
jgi:hypothetical protein